MKRKRCLHLGAIKYLGKVFDDKGKSNELIKMYDEISKKYMTGKK